MLNQVDEHGMSLVEYTRTLRKMVSQQEGATSYREEAIENASEIQHGLAELARTQQVDAIAKAIANRPDLEQLQQRNILPAESDLDKMAKRKRLEEGLAHRPAIEELQQRGVLHAQSSSPS